MLCQQIEIGLLGFFYIPLPRSKGDWLIRKPFFRAQPASEGRIVIKKVSFYDESLASNINGAEGVIVTPVPTCHFSLYG